MNNKKFLIAVLSLILLFAVSCSNEDKTGGGRVSPTLPETDSGISPSSPADSGGTSGSDIDNQIKALFGDSVPNPTGRHTKGLDDVTYGGDLDIKWQFFGEPEKDEGKMFFTLEIKGNNATLKRSKDGNETAIKNKEIYETIDGKKYFCRFEEKNNVGNMSIYYIEFYKTAIDKINFKYIDIYLDANNKSDSCKDTRTGDLTKQ